jgi:ATP/maltotriose-dependent transcriptional regulator MalT/DNA-binding SARP family transcriptional activator
MAAHSTYEMPRPNFFLRTKLLPPRAGTDLLERPRLTQKLESNLDAPVTLVAADAGCGKTTLVAGFLRSQQRPSVWYQMDHTDADPTAFLSYVAHGIREFEPGFGETLLPYLAEADENVSESAERAADLLINEILESIEQPFILVLDDYHHIGRETVVHRIVDRIIQYSSELVHIMITTRDLPPLAIMKRRMQASALVITRDELLFNDNEVRDLFKSTLNVELGDEELTEYRQRTHGWITALQLVRQVAEHDLNSPNGDKKLDLLEALRQSEKDIFDYFAEEVFSREPEGTQKLLLHLSLLDSMPLDDCSALFPDLRCSALLPELSQNNVFITAVGEGATSEEYRFHPLFRDFLRRRLRSQIGKTAVADERVRIANSYKTSGHWEKSVPFLLEAENFASAAELIAEHGDDWLAAGANETLRVYAEKIPAAELEKHPRALLHLAEVSRIRGETERSALLLRSALRPLRELNDTAGEAEALHSLASLARRRGNIKEAFDLLAQAEKLVTDESETAVKCANTRGLCLISEGKWAEAEQQFRFALELAEKQASRKYIRLITHNLALPAGFRGDFPAALGWFRRIFRDGVDDRPLPQEAIGHLNVSRLHLYRGELADAEKHLERALELCQLFGMRSLLAEVFEAYGNFYRESGDAQHAEEFYERSLKAYEEAEINLASRELNEERARFYLSQGDTKRARALITKLLSQRESQANEVGLHTARLCLAQVDLAESKTNGIVERIEELIEFFQSRGHYYDECLTSMLMAETVFDKDKPGDALPFINRVLDLSARFDYDHWLRQQIRRRPEIFKIEEIAERLPFDLTEEFTSTPKIQEPPTAISEVASPITDLTVNVLGPIEIFRDPSKPFAPDAWTTRRARDIFCYIATSKHRRVPKDVLIETFWPDEDPSVVEKNFHPTISHIRKALNSRQAFKQNFIVFRDGAYQLNPELSFLIDAEEFDRHFADAEIAKREKDNGRLRTSLENAHRCYRGEFMDGIYEDWAEERRHYYSEQFGRVTAALARLELGEKRLASARKYAEETLTVDPYREDIHRLILKIYAAQAKPASIKKHYESMQELLKKDLGVEPSAETRRLAAELLK